MAERSYVGAALPAVAPVWWMPLRLLFGPLWERFRLGEGLLLAVNGAVVGFLAPDLWTGAATLALSAGVLAAAYSVNDLHDAEADRSNPKKNAGLVAALLENRRTFTRVLLAVHAGLVAFAGLTLGPRAALAALAMLCVNAVYSMRAKGTPLLDLVVVAWWGGLFVAIAAAPTEICVLVGVMTLLMHVFQMHVDREVDARNAVRTSAVAWGRPTALLAGVCAALGLTLLGTLGPLWALTAAVPLGAHLGVRRTQTAWMLSRAYLAIVILVALEGARAGA